MSMSMCDELLAVASELESKGERRLATRIRSIASRALRIQDLAEEARAIRKAQFDFEHR